MNIKENMDISDKMLKAINNRDYEIFDHIMAENFIDHHPGLGEGINSRKDYVNALRFFIEALDLTAELEKVFVKENYTVIYGLMKGVHQSEFLGVKPTGNKIKWNFIEVYRLEEGRIKERWSLDDTVSLLNGMNINLFK